MPHLAKTPSSTPGQKEAEAVVVSFSSCCPPDEVVSRAFEVLEAGNLVVGPTETRYALMARADRAESLEKLYLAKGRQENAPSAVFVPNVESLAQWCELSEGALRLAEEFLPGPLTIVAKSKVTFDPRIMANGKVGFRVSSCPFIAALAMRSKFLITATSANRSRGAELATISEIAKELGAAVSLYCDAGRLENSVSTVVDVSAEQPLILRQGAYDAGGLAAAWGNTC